MKKFLFVLALVLCLGISAFALDGEGTEESPFIIECEEELALLHDFPDCYFNLGCDIELTEDWTTVGTLGDAFSAVFDGCGYTISNFKGGTEFGLFDTNNGTIRNLNLEWTDEEEYTYNKTYLDSGDFYCVYCGVLCNQNIGIIENCSVSGNVKMNIKVNGSNHVYVGGIIGKNSDTIQNSTVDITLNVSDTYKSAWLYLGGITGENYGTSSKSAVIDKCNAFINMSCSGSSYRSTGGISCRTTNSKIANSYVIGILSGGNVGGGMCGIAYSGIISNCYASVSGTILGVASQFATVTNSYYDKTVSGNTDTGYGEPKSTSAMKMKLTYTKAGWDFDNVWGISKEINNGYPYLLWEYPEKEEDILTETEAYEHDNKLVFDVSIYANAPSKLTQIGLYGEGGRFIKSFMVPNLDSKKDITVVMDNEEDAVSAKIFVWENTESIKPLAECEEVQIVRSEA